MVFADWKPSIKAYTCETLDGVLVQWQNMAVCENAEIAKSQNLQNVYPMKIETYAV